MHTYFLDDAFLYIWKPHGIPSTFGKELSFLESVLAMDFFAQQKYSFSSDQEYGLLNRLDNDTAGLLYFARNKDIYDRYIGAQDTGKIIKHYIAGLAGKVTTIPSIIAYPIGHHRHHADRMIVRLSADDDVLIRGHRHYTETCLSYLGYSDKQNITRIHIMLTKGVRHQIRSHLASVGLPLLGEKIYKKKKDTQILHLRSVGLTADL